MQGNIEEDVLEEDGGDRELMDALDTPASSGSSSHGELLRLVTYQLREQCEDAPPDSLAPLAAAVSRTLGGSHPVARHLRQLAEINMSASAKQARELRRQQRKVAAATAVLQVCLQMHRAGWVWELEDRGASPVDVAVYRETQSPAAMCCIVILHCLVVPAGTQTCN
jgi:hypothetical protein